VPTIAGSYKLYMFLTVLSGTTPIGYIYNTFSVTVH
jgi:hypothetical protein